MEAAVLAILNGAKSFLYPSSDLNLNLNLMIQFSLQHRNLKYACVLNDVHSIQLSAGGLHES